MKSLKSESKEERERVMAVVRGAELGRDVGRIRLSRDGALSSVLRFASREFGSNATFECAA
jgi:hypothetical protein